MTGHGRLPGDPAAGDPMYGPLNGLFDDLHHDAHGRERERDVEGARLLRGPDALRPPRPRRIATIRAFARRLLSHRSE